MGALRTSQEDVVVAGEGTQVRTHEDRAVDAGEAKIIIAPGPVAEPVPPTPPLRPLPQPPPPAPATSGPWLVVLVYLLATAALAAAIYERFFL